MNSLDAIAQSIFNLDIENDIRPNFVQYKVMRLYADNTTKCLSGNDKTNANTKYGVYLHTIADGPIAYTGKAERCTIAQRQSSHFTTFRNPSNTNEMTGKKYRKYIKDNGLQYIDIIVEYLDMSKYPKVMIPMLELQLMEYYQPILNQETFDA